MTTQLVRTPEGVYIWYPENLDGMGAEQIWGLPVREPPMTGGWDRPRLSAHERAKVLRARKRRRGTRERSYRHREQAFPRRRWGTTALIGSFRLGSAIQGGAPEKEATVNDGSTVA